jgi:hypothetical protein
MIGPDLEPARIRLRLGFAQNPLVESPSANANPAELDQNP